MQSTATEPNFVDILGTIADRTKVDPRLRSVLTDARELLLAEREGDRPFLTVILRTQGARLETLRDALLSLLAQTVQDFEIILLMHDIAPDKLEGVRQIVEGQPASFRDRIHLESVEGGGRSRPLNVGIERARGRYISVFDDDDLLFAHWVETFRDAAEGNSGRLIRSVVAIQTVEPEVWPNGLEGFRSLSWPNLEYPEEFDQLQHLLVNYSPFMSWAFPWQLFKLYGVRFDEELTVTEDWDVILRGSLLCGVTGAPELTAIYRRWQNADSSYTKHSTSEWAESEQRVIERIDQNVMLMPPGTMQSIRRMVLLNNALRSYRFLFHGHRLRHPLDYLWRAATPGVKLAVRVRNRVRRPRAR